MAQDQKSGENRKQSLYFQDEMLTEIRAEAARLDRSISWVVQRAWKVGRAAIRKLEDCPPEDD